MSDSLLVPRAKLEQFRDAFAEELAAYDIDPPIHHLQQGHDDCVMLLSAAPAVPERWVIVCETVLDVGHGKDVRTGGRPELGYALLSHAVTFPNEDAARAAHKSVNLPLGWVIMPLSRLLPDLSAAPAVPLTREQQIAIREAHCNTASDEYFGARPQIEDVPRRRIYEAGFKEGWESGIGPTGGGK